MARRKSLAEKIEMEPKENLFDTKEIPLDSIIKEVIDLRTGNIVNRDYGSPLGARERRM